MAPKKLSLLLIGLLTCVSQPALTQGGGAGSGGKKKRYVQRRSEPGDRPRRGSSRSAGHNIRPKIGASRSVYK